VVFQAENRPGIGSVSRFSVHTRYYTRVGYLSKSASHPALSLCRLKATVSRGEPL
jgi:hypothetical protein